MMQNDLAILKESIRGIDYRECLLFGSQARNTGNAQSDYDILIVMKEPVSHAEKFEIMGRIRDRIAPHLIPVVIIVKSADEVERQKNLRGSLVRNALAEAVLL